MYRCKACILPLLKHFKCGISLCLPVCLSCNLFNDITICCPSDNTTCCTCWLKFRLLSNILSLCMHVYNKTRTWFLCGFGDLCLSKRNCLMKVCEEGRARNGAFLTGCHCCQHGVFSTRQCMSNRGQNWQHGMFRVRQCPSNRVQNSTICSAWNSV